MTDRTVNTCTISFVVLLTAAVVIGEELCFHGPSSSVWIQPSPPCIPPAPYDDCSMNELDDPSLGFTLCVPVYEPSYKKCQNIAGNPPGKKYIGTCVGDYWCDYVLENGQKLFWEPNAGGSPYSMDIGYCDNH